MAKFEIFQDNDGEYRWRFQSNSGKILAISGEGYNNRANCEHAIILIKREAPHATMAGAVVTAPPKLSGA
jgi:uncharacterized protein YegP (UPF0339 family)